MAAKRTNLVKIASGIAVALVALWVLKDVAASAVIAGGIKAVTGLGTKIGRVSVGLLNTSIGIRGLQVQNPRGYQDRLFVDVPEIYVNYKVLPLLRGKAHLEEVRLHLKELHVVKTAQGVNLNAVKALGPATAKGQAQPAPAQGMPNLEIDVLALKVGKVVYRDETTSPATVKEFAVNLDERHEHITHPTILAGLIVSRALMKTTVAQLANFDVAGLQAVVTQGLRESAGRVAETTGALADRVTKDAGAMTRGAAGVTREAAGAAQEAVGEATGMVKKIFGN
jgi:hypothetical protein